ncbi:hypothetical protein Aduo_001592 [Ancylostoma duodenale]
MRNIAARHGSIGGKRYEGDRDSLKALSQDQENVAVAKVIENEDPSDESFVLERLEDREDREKQKRRARDVPEEAARGQVGCFSRANANGEIQAKEPPADQRFGPPAVSNFSDYVIEIDSSSAEEVILAHLSAGKVKETEIVIKPDGKMRLSISGTIHDRSPCPRTVASPAVGFRLLSNQWREDCWIGHRYGIEPKFDDLGVANFGDVRRLQFSLQDTIKMSLLSSACFNGLADMEELQSEHLERSVVVPL